VVGVGVDVAVRVSCVVVSGRDGHEC
jgi:hypothetical protein